MLVDFIRHGFMVINGKDTLFMGETDDRGLHYLLFEADIPTYSRIVHFLHEFLAALFVEFFRKVFVFAQQEEAWGESVQSVQHKKLFYPHFMF